MVRSFVHRSLVVPTLVVLIAASLLVGAAPGVAGAAVPASAACGAVGADLGTGLFTPISPVRVLDSRTTNGGWASPLVAGSPRNLTVAGVAGIPLSATAIEAVVTVTSTTATSALAVWKAGDALPSTRQFGYVSGSTFAQHVSVAIGTGGAIRFGTDVGSTDVIVDVRGYYAATGAACQDVAPFVASSLPVKAGLPVEAVVTGNGVPESATAVVVRLDATSATSASFANVFPSGAAMPATSLLNFREGTDLQMSNVFTVGVGTGGKVAIANASGTAALELTVLGFFGPTADGSRIPVGAVSLTPPYGSAPVTVQATAALSGSFTNLAWEWGDGSTSTGAAPAHDYLSGGQLRVRLRATTGGVTYISDRYLGLAGFPRPTPPPAPTATAQRFAVRAQWTAASGGGTPITSYTATASPGGATCTTASTSCTIRGLDAGTVYTVRVTATSVAGTSVPSDPSNEVAPYSGSPYAPEVPVRVLDSRTATGGWNGPLVAGQPRTLELASGGPTGIQRTDVAVVLNVTVTGATNGSFLKLWATGSPPPTTSSINFGPGQTVANLVTVQLGDGKVDFANAVGAADVVVDLVGVYDDGNRNHAGLYRAAAPGPTRVLDSRTSLGGWNGPLSAGASRDLLVRQPSVPNGLPATTIAVVANITVTNSTANSFLSVVPRGAPAGTSTLNFAAGETVANLAIVLISGDGMTFRTAAGSTDVVVDVVGYFELKTWAASASFFHAIPPGRFLDDRVGVGATGPWGSGQSRTVPVAGAPASHVPAGATAFVANLTATNGSTGSYLTAYPTGSVRPASSSLNFGPQQTVANATMPGLGTGGGLDIANAVGSVDVVGDAVGYFAPA